MKIRVLSWLMLVVLLGILGINQCKTKEDTKEITETNAYVGSESCKSCHTQEHSDWIKSHHYNAMLPAGDSTVLGNFNNESLTADGVTSRFFKKDGKYFINTQGDDSKNHDYEIKYIFGFSPLQQYLVEFPGGKMQATRASWDNRKKQWYDQYPGQKIPSHDWLHWTGNGQNWNTMCASCHSTNLQKGYDENTDLYHTTFNEVNVSCESCHGPGKLHISYINSKNYTANAKVPGAFLTMTKDAPKMERINGCGYCHARRTDITGSVLPGKEIMNDLIPELPTTDFFYADGQMRDEDYNYTSFLESKMFRHGVECSNCHNPHSGRLKLEGSIVCSQCHPPATFNTPSHTMHAENSSGSSCINCHMPSKIYMGIDLRHDHSFRIPRPDLSVQYGTPNTCNSCHKDKTPQWAADAIKKNFGPVRRYHFAEDLVPGSQLTAGSEGHLTKLIGDTAIPNIVRAASADYLGRLNTKSGIEVLLSHVTDSSAMVRFFSIGGLFNTDPAVWMNPVAPLLKDSVRAVRIKAAELFTFIPVSQVPSENLTAFYSAKGELESFINYQKDFAQGNARAGDYYLRTNQRSQAEKYYRRALAKDDLLTIAKINLASALSAGGKNEEALQQLLNAEKDQPKNDQIQYNLALLYVEMNQLKKAESSFEKAVSFRTHNPRIFYNYGLLLQKMNESPSIIEKTFTRGLEIDPQNGDLLFALAVFYFQQKQIQKSIETAKILKQYHGDNPNYQPLFQQLHI
ncbi:MAG TPA: tetratricopeptide repeat protein [Puia sp.]